VFHSISILPHWIFLMVYSKASLKSNDNKISPYLRAFCIGNASDISLPMRTLLKVSFKRILISLTRYMGIPNSTRILYNTSALL